MVKLQILSKCLNTGSFDIVTQNNLMEDYFLEYEEEFNFIRRHVSLYGKVPDKETMLQNFPDFPIIEVKETDDFLISTLREEYLYSQMVSVVQETADKMRNDSREALNYLSAQVVALNSQNIVGGSNIVKKAKERLELHQQKKEFGTNYIKTGFPELDEVIYGLEPGNELLTVAGRPNQGKTWILLKMLVEAWKQGKRVSMYSGEMNDMQIGYRFDTLLANFSNKALVIGENVSGYEDFIDKTQKNMLPFYVFTPKSFGGRATVSSIQSMITACKADIVGIDQYSLMDDETYRRGKSKTEQLFSITEGLMRLSERYDIPIIGLSQLNRDGDICKDNVQDDPDLTNLADSDSIGQNSSKVLFIRQTGAGLKLSLTKNRTGAVGVNLIYFWDIDKGRFVYVPSATDSVAPQERQKVEETQRKKYKDRKEVF